MNQLVHRCAEAEGKINDLATTSMRASTPLEESFISA
jgi:hypothetical protein